MFFWFQFQKQLEINKWKCIDLNRNTYLKHLNTLKHV